MNYWLMKTEPSSFGLEDLRKRPKQTERWDGVRNYQARNFMRAMQKGDLAFLYHSSCEVPGIAAIVEITREAYPDTTAFDPKHHHHDPKSDPKNPRWFMVDVTLRCALKRIITLAELKDHRDKLAGFTLLRTGNRLSVIPVDKRHWDYILGLE